MIGYSQAFEGLYGPKPMEGNNVNSWRFRTNWQGKLVLQRQVKYYNIRMYMHDYYWRDAKTQDLQDYYNEHQQQNTSKTA